jgi:hypothetical protein
LILLSVNARSAVRVFTGEAGEAFTLFLAVFALKPAVVFPRNYEALKKQWRRKSYFVTFLKLFKV